jgi:hypothetical protein
MNAVDTRQFYWASDLSYPLTNFQSPLRVEVGNLAPHLNTYLFAPLYGALERRVTATFEEMAE